MSLRQSESELPASIPEEDKSKLVMSRPEEDKATELEQAVEQELKQEVAAEQAVVTVEEHELEQVVEQEGLKEVAAKQAVVTVEEHEEVQALLREANRPEEETATGLSGVVKFLLRRVASWIVRPSPSINGQEEAEGASSERGRVSDK